MALDLEDVRCKYPKVVMCHVRAEARARDIDACEVLREIMLMWAKERHAVHIETRRQLRAEGLVAADQGSSGSDGNPLKDELKWD